MPLVQRQVASLSAVLAIVATLAFGILFGPLGIFLATPLAVAMMIWVKLLYVEDVLGKRVER